MRLKDKVILITASAYTTGQILTVSGGFGLPTPIYGDLAGKDRQR